MDIDFRIEQVFADSPLFSQIKQVQEDAKKMLSEKRFVHSVGVAQTAFKMCRLYGEKEDRGFLAGIGHDICKEIPSEKVIELAEKDGLPVSEMERKKPSLLHGRAAAVLLKEKYGVSDEELLESVAFHTYGLKTFGTLGKIIYSADKIEPGRENITQEYLDHLFSLTLNELTEEVLRECMDYVNKKGFPLAPESVEFLEQLEKSRSACAVAATVKPVSALKSAAARN